MGDWWLLAWCACGITGAFVLAGGSMWYARRNGRRWYEVLFTSQPLSIAAMTTYAYGAVLVGPLWGIGVAVGSVAVVVATLYALAFYLEWRAKRAVLARENGK